MKLLYFCPLWGSESIPFELFLHRAKDAGYDGVEMSFPLEEKERDKKAAMVHSFGLKLIAQHWETVDQNPTLYRQNFERRLRNLAATNPLMINTQTGKDYYSFEQNCELFDLADAIAQETAMPIIHETHRGKWSFAAHITKQYLIRRPDLKITLDLSHWCATAESFLEDQAEAVKLAIQATAHVHARVGYTEGPQVTDPTAPQWQHALNHHVAWWDQVIDLGKSRGTQSLSITPEFGAAPYLVLHPQSGQPLVDQWEVNVWMMNFFKNRYSSIAHEEACNANLKQNN